MTGDLTSDMRRALLTANKPLGVFLGPGTGEVARVTARALITRELAAMDGSRLRLTDAGLQAARDVAAAHRRLLHG